MPSAFPAKMFPKSEQCELDNYKLQVEILQQKLAKSEEQRQQLEEKFEKIQKKRGEHEKSMKAKSRVKFEEFLEKQRERNERNKKIIRMLEHIDQQAALLSQRSSRLKAMKRQYELYFARLLQSQAFRIQNSPRYSYLPINQYMTLAQPNEIISMLTSKDNVTGISPAILSTQNDPTVLLQSGNVVNHAKQNIPSIITMPATPPGAITPNTVRSNQPSSSSLGVEQWNILTPNNNFPIPNIQNFNSSSMPLQHPQFMGGTTKVMTPSFRDNFNYPSQPNQMDYYNAGLSNQHNLMQASIPAGAQPNPILGHWGIPPRISNPYTDTGMPTEDFANTMGPSQKSVHSNQRTFRDFDKGDSGLPNKNLDRRFVKEKHTLPNDYDFSRATEDDLNLLRGLTYRNRMRTFNDSSENLSQSGSNQDLYSYDRKDAQQDAYVPRALRTTELRQRSPSRYSLSRSASIEERTLSPSKEPHDNYIPSNTERDRSERSPSEISATPYLNSSMSGNNIDDERDINTKQRDSDKMDSSTIRRTSTVFANSLPPTINTNSQYATDMQSPSSLSSAAKQQYNSPNSALNKQTFSSLSTPNAINNVADTIQDLSSNKDKIILPSNKNNTSNVLTPSYNIRSGVSAGSAKLPTSHYNDDGVTAAEKKQRPALLKKIQLPEYLSHKSNVEKNRLGDERTDADILKLNQSLGNDLSPLQFAKKEKLSLDNIESAIYGELINPELSTSSTSPTEAVAQVLRQHQTPAQIIAQTNQGRRATVESFKPKLDDFKEVSEPINEFEKSDLSEKLNKNKIEMPNTKILNMNLEKLKLDEPIVTAPSSTTPLLAGIETSKLVKPESPRKDDFSNENVYENFKNRPEEIHSNEETGHKEIQPDLQKTFEYDNTNSENFENYNQPSDTISNSFTNQEKYQNQPDLTQDNEIYPESQSYTDPTQDNEIYPESQSYTNPNEPNNIYQTEQPQYDIPQDYQHYNQEGYTQDEQNAYQNYPTDNNYQTEYDPNAYNYNYEQQQQGEGTYGAYDPNQQQYPEPEYNQPSAYQDTNYNDQQYSQQEYADSQNPSDQVDPNQYDYSQQDVAATEGYDEPTEIKSKNDTEQPADSNQVVASNIAPNNSSPAVQPKSVKPILTKEKSVDLEHKKKKRVNFVDSSDDSSSKTQQQSQQQQPTPTDESDFDFSSQ